jgi:hypothetical protein
MPNLDVSEIFSDPDFVDFNLQVTRSPQSIDADGFAVDNSSKEPFSGIVTVDRSLEAQRRMSGQVITGAILIVTQHRLTAGQTGIDADIVTYQNRDYIVTSVDPYTAYGAGFVQAHCELQPFDGGTPIE